MNLLQIFKKQFTAEATAHRTDHHSVIGMEWSVGMDSTEPKPPFRTKFKLRKVTSSPTPGTGIRHLVEFTAARGGLPDQPFLHQ